MSIYHVLMSNRACQFIKSIWCKLHGMRRS